MPISVLEGGLEDNRPPHKLRIIQQSRPQSHLPPSIACENSPNFGRDSAACYLLFYQVSIKLGQSNTVEELRYMVERAVLGAHVAAPQISGSSGDTGASADTLAAMNVAAQAAVEAASDSLRGEGGALNEGDEDSGGGDWEVDVSSSYLEACRQQGSVLMRQAVAADQGTKPNPRYCQDLEPNNVQGRFLGFSGDTVGPEGCDLRNGEELILVRPKRLVFRHSAASATID